MHRARSLCHFLFLLLKRRCDCLYLEWAKCICDRGMYIYLGGLCPGNVEIFLRYMRPNWDEEMWLINGLSAMNAKMGAAWEIFICENNIQMLYNNFEIFEGMAQHWDEIWLPRPLCKCWHPNCAIIYSFWFELVFVAIYLLRITNYWIDIMDTASKQCTHSQQTSASWYFIWLNRKNRTTLKNKFQ